MNHIEIEGYTYSLPSESNELSQKQLLALIRLMLLDLSAHERRQRVFFVLLEESKPLIFLQKFEKGLEQTLIKEHQHILKITEKEARQYVLWSMLYPFTYPFMPEQEEIIQIHGLSKQLLPVLHLPAVPINEKLQGKANFEFEQSLKELSEKNRPNMRIWTASQNASYKEN
jgi:hypothetical protein